MPTLRIKTLHCGTTEDDTGNDETSLRVSGARYHEWRQDMNNGQDWDVNADIAFNNRARVEVWDLDAGRWWDPHDKLGTHIINAEQRGQGEKDAVFDAYGSYYVLTYEVV